MITNSVLTGGTYITQNIDWRTPHGTLRILKDASSPSAFHNSGARYDPPKCHENTRMAVLEKIMDWVIGCDQETKDKWIMWLYGSAGAGKSAIAQTFAERCEKDGLLLASFFFGRSDATRNNAKFLIPTIACQVYSSVPGARQHIISAVENDPLIFERTLLVQLLSLVIEPLKQLGDTISQNVIIIDGLDECLDTAARTIILRIFFETVRDQNCRIRVLVASRPEHDIVTVFSLQSLNSALVRLVLDDTYKPDDDIRFFLNQKIQEIKETHPFRHLIPQEWPGDALVNEIVKKSSGQFIYTSTVIRFIESNRHRPDHRLDIVRNLRPPQGDMPFEQLDALYTHILSSVEDTVTVVEILSFILHAAQINGYPYAMIPIKTSVASMEDIHDIERGCLKLVLCDLGSLLAIDELDTVKVLHASLLDYLLDSSRCKGLPVSGDRLIAKHITACFRFLSKNTNTFSDNSTLTVVMFLAKYLGCITLFTTDMARALSGFSPSKLFGHRGLSVNHIHIFLNYVNPLLLELMGRSNQPQFLSRYLTMLDEFYVALMDQYPPQTLALQISILMLGNHFPRQILELPFQLLPFPKSNDYLAILGATEAHKNVLRVFLLYPARSKHHNLRHGGMKIYAEALLGCFSYLEKVYFSHDSSIDESWLNESGMRRKGSTQEYNQAATGRHVSEHENEVDSETDHPENETAVPENDIQTWFQDWHRIFRSPMDYPSASWIDTTELPGIGEVFESEDFQIMLRVRYYLVLGYMIFFFPFAGESEVLITLCKTIVLRRDAKLFPEQTASAQRAMTAYVKRMAKTIDSSRSITPNPSDVSASHSEIVAHDGQLQGSLDKSPKNLEMTITRAEEIVKNYFK